MHAKSCPLSFLSLIDVLAVMYLSGGMAGSWTSASGPSTSCSLTPVPSTQTLSGMLPGTCSNRRRSRGRGSAK